MHELGFKKHGHPAYICFRAGDNEYQKLEWIKKSLSKTIRWGVYFYTGLSCICIVFYSLTWRPCGQRNFTLGKICNFCSKRARFQYLGCGIISKPQPSPNSEVTSISIMSFYKRFGRHTHNGKDVTTSVSTWWWIYFENTVISVSVTSALFALRENNSRIGQHASLKTLNVRGPINAVHHS